ncbi:MAG: class I SAM-dependent methyltransferase [Planctomycetes bacterium]|nr:class I SAM-dependent methyltransferase [Planctomycetota bacterium]
MDTEKDTFYDHYSQDKHTRFGGWLAASVTKNIFDFAQISQQCGVLEIGPGRGAFADLCIDKGIDYRAIEPNEQMADNLQKRGINVIRNVVPPLPEMGRTFDVVVMNSVMEHMDTMNSALELSKDVYKLLNPGGKFVIYVPDYANWRHHFFIGDFSHNYITTWRRLEGLLISAGFEDINGRYQCTIFSGVLGYLISILASWLPFGWFDTMFPKSRLWHKLYKMQITFLRRVLILGQKTG